MDGTDKTGDHGGSGIGSTTNATTNIRSIVYSIVKEYNISSILDAPCGSMSWIPLLLTNISSEIPNFKYHGVDVVNSIIAKSQEKYQHMAPLWRMSTIEISREPLPTGYDLIFSRDALQHLPLLLVIDCLENFARTNRSKYLLVGSYYTYSDNRNIEIGDYFPINLFTWPFYLTKYIQIFNERYGSKYLYMYDIPNYLRNVDFQEMRNRVKD